MAMKINRRQKLLARSLLGLAVALLAHAAQSTTLAQAYEAARSADAKFQSARHERDAGLQVVPVARAQLLPAVSVSASYFKNKGYRDIPRTATTTSREILDYDSPQRSLNMRLGLYNAENLRRYEQAKKQAAYSEVIFVTRDLDLVDRLGTAYFQVLLAKEELDLIDAQVTALSAQSQSAERRFQGGEGTRTEIAESQARLDSARAQRIDTEAGLKVAIFTLESMTGQKIDTLFRVPADFVPPALAPVNLEDWLNLAKANSPLLAARRLAVEVAEAEVSKSRAGHLPRLDLIASVSRSRSDSVNTLDQDLYQKSLGLQLNIPIYSGGYVNAVTEQALANLRRAQSDLDAEIESAETNVRRTFLASDNGMARVTAYQKALSASQTALEGARRGLTAGVRTNVEVLDAQRQVFVTQRDLAQARYEYLLARLRLLSASGSQPQQIIDDVSAFLVMRP